MYRGSSKEVVSTCTDFEELAIYLEEIKHTDIKYVRDNYKATRKQVNDNAA